MFVSKTFFAFQNICFRNEIVSKNVKLTEFSKVQRSGMYAAKKIKSAGVTQIISTNTIPGDSAKVDVSKVISDALK